MRIVYLPCWVVLLSTAAGFFLSARHSLAAGASDFLSWVGLGHDRPVTAIRETISAIVCALAINWRMIDVRSTMRP